MANALTYIKNVGKSIGYASFDVAKKMNPVFSEFAETNGELASDMYKSVRDIKKRVKDGPNKIMNSKYGKFGKTYLDNLVDDLKTGKFYNKERIDKAASSFGGDDFDFDFGGSDDDLNFDFGSSDDSFDIEPSTNQMMDLVAEKASNAVSTTMTRTAEYIVQSNTESSRAMYNQINAIYGGIHTGMSTINQNLAKILEFSTGSVVTHFENSRTFYTEVTRMDQERNQYLKDILDTVKAINNPLTKQSSISSKNRYSDLVSFGGTVDISRYMENVKKNIKNSMGMFSMIDMLFDDGFAEEFTSSPVSSLLKLAISVMVPSNIKKSTEKLNKSFSGLFGNLMMGLKEKGKEFGLWDTIANIFGINTSIKKLDPKDYEKGKIPFDGVTKKAITEVIPTYLSKILVAVTKRPQDEDRFNYETGKFVKVSKLKSDFDDITKDSANRAAWEMDSVIRTKKKGLNFRNKDEERQFDEDWEALKLYLYKNQKDFSTRDKKLTGKTFGLKGGMASDINVRLFQELLDGTSEKINYAHNLFREIDDQNRRMMELQDSSTYTALANDSVDFSSLSGTTTGAAQQKQSKSKSKDKKKNKRKNKAQDAINNGANYGELDKESEIARIMGKAKQEAPINEDKQSFSQRMNSASGLSAKIAVLVQSASELAKKPAKFIVSMLDKADERLYDLIYGPKDDKTGRKSFVGRLFNGLENIFNKFSNFMDEHIIEPFKNIFSKENMKDTTKKLFNAFGIDIEDLVKDVRVRLFGKKNEDGKREGGIFSKFMNDFKDGFKGAFDWVKGAFKSVGDWFGVTSKKNAKGQAKEQQNAEKQNQANILRSLVSQATSDITEAATGLKRVDKTGLAVISEGEMIVPPDMNPFNIAKRKRDEKKVKDKLKFGIDSITGFAEGNVEELYGKFAAKNPKLFAKFINQKTKGMSKEEKDEYLKKYTNMADNLESSKESFTKDDYEEGRNPYKDRIWEEIYNFRKMIQNTASTFGMSDDDVEKFKKNATDFIGNIKEYGGTMAAGATIGAGLSVITGFIGGPLVGAAVGASIGLIQKSETVQNLLFGKIGKDGEREGNIISKELQQNIKKYLPDMGKGAAVGGILTALPIIPGGPVAGIIVGSALGFAKNNQGIQDALFGEGNTGTENKEKFKKKVQSLMPKMGLGALTGLLAGPFASTPLNLILGSALGFAADSDAFKDVVFGEVNKETGKREGGIFRTITNPAIDFFKKSFDEFKTFMQNDMIAPIRNAIQPISNEIKYLFKSLTDNLGEMFKERIGRTIERLLKDTVVDKVGKFFSGLIKFATKPAKWVLSAPSKIIGGIGESLRVRQVKRGRYYGSSAATRNALRRSKGELGMLGDQFGEFDESLEAANVETIGAAKDALTGILNVRKTTAEASHDAYGNIRKGLYNESNNIDRVIAKEALRMVRDGYYDQALKFIQTSALDDAAKTRAAEIINKEKKKLEVQKAIRGENESLIPQLADTLKNVGIKVDPKKLAKDPALVKKYIDMLGDEEKFKKGTKSNSDGKLKTVEDVHHEEHMKKLDTLIETIKGLKSDATKKVDPEATSLEESTETSTDDQPIEESTSHKVRGNIANANLTIRQTIKELKNDMLEGFGAVKTSVKGVIGNIKNNEIYKKYFGDGKDYHITNNGLSLKLRKTKDGEVEPDITDSQTKNNLKIIEEERNTNKGILAGLTSLPNQIGSIFGELFGKKKDDKDKKSFFEKILDFFTGEGTITLGTVLKGAIPAALLALGITGKLDKIASALTGGAFGKKDSNDTIMGTDSNGNKVEVLLNENGEPVTDANGNYVSATGEVLSNKTYLTNTGAVATMSLSDRLKYNFVRNTLTGKGSIIGTAFKTNKLVKAGKSLVTGKKTGDGILKTVMKSATDVAAKAEITDKIIDITTKLTSALKNIPALSKFADKLDDLGQSLALLVEKYLPKAGAKLTKIASGLRAAAGVFAFAMVAVDYTTGAQDASTTLKIRKENVTEPQKILCGLIRVLKNAIPVIGTFVPDSVITDFFIDRVAKWFRISKSELTKQRDEAQAELDAYKAEHPEAADYTWADYNKKVLGNYTWTENIGNSVSSFVTNVKSKGLKGTVSSIGSSIKNSKVGQAVGKAGQWIGDKASNIWQGTKNIGSAAIGKVKDAGSWIKEQFTGFISPVLDEVSKRINIAKDIGSYTINVVKDTWKEMISGEEISSDNLHIDENDPYGSYKKIIYNLVKIVGLVPSGIIKLGKGIWNHGIKPIVNGIKTIGSGVGTTVKNQFVNAWNGNINEIFTDSSGNAQSGNLFLDSVSGALNGITKVLLTAPTLLTAGIGGVVRGFKDVISGIKTIGSGVGTTVKNLFTNAWSGDLIGAFSDRSGNSKSGNIFLDSISGAINSTTRVLLTIPTLLTSGVGLVVRNFDNIISGIKTIGSGVGTTVKNLFTNAWNGDIIEAFTDRSGNTQTGNIFLDSISGAINSTARVTLAVPTLLTAVVGSAVTKVTDFVKSVAEAGTISAEDQSVLDRSNSGEVSVFSREYWKVSTHLTGPAGAFNTFISLMKKLFNLPSALIANISPSNLLEKATNKLAEWFGIDDSETGRGSRLAGRGSGTDNTFISQIDPRYRNKKFNIAGDTQEQTLGDSGCAPAAAAMAVNATLGTKYATMEDASRLALKYKVKNDGVNASYFNDEFARHGIYAKYITSSNNKSQEITRQLMNNNKVVLMGQDAGNTSKATSPFGPNPHYVVATGLSEDGKFIYINDPESTTSNIKYRADKILNSSKLGIAATVARGTKKLSNKFKKYIGRGSYGPETVQYKVWNALRAAGYNEIAVAAAMGNIQAESGFNVSAIEKGSGAGFGLIQWTDTRRTAIENYARQKGVSVNSLELQLEYLLKELESGSGIWTGASSSYGFGTLSRNDWANGRDLVKATKAFMCCFERPSYDSNINHIDRRIAAAKEYYEAFTGTTIDVNIDYGTDSQPYTPSSSSSSTGSLGFISEMISAFGDLAKVYKIKDNFWSSDEESSSSSSSSDYYTSGTYYSGSANGNVSSNEEHANLQRALVDKMYSIQGTLKYAQDNAKYPGSRNPDDGSGDCSSTIQWAYKKILGVDPGSWTGAQRDNTNTYTVATSTLDESKLQLGDLLLKDGHVEMYAGNNTMIGHGGGKDGKKLGPTVSPLDKSGAYNLVRRYIKFKGSGSGLFGRGSDVHPTESAYDNALRYINPEEFTSILPFGLDDNELNKNKVPVMEYNSNKLSVVKNSPKKTSPKSKNVGRASNIDDTTTSGSMIELVKSIIKLLVQIVTNTDQLNNIVSLLGEYITATTSSDNTKDSQKTAIIAKQNLINAMQSSSKSSEPNAQLMRLIEATERIARE